MKTNHKINTVLLAVTVLVLLASGLVHADNIYVSCYDSGTIVKFDSSGNRSTFASGLDHPYGLAFDSSGYLYVTLAYSGTIMKFDSYGNGSVFASGLDMPAYITTQIPEPATLLLLGLGAVTLRRKPS